MGIVTTDVFLKIALEKGFLDEKKLDQIRVLRDLARRDGKLVPIGAACLDLEILTKEQVRGLERGVRYYVVRKADKIYGKLAVARKYVDADTVEHCLARQHSEFVKHHRLVRLSKLLAGLEAITPEQDADVRALVQTRLTPEESDEEMAAVTEPPPGAAPLTPRELPRGLRPVPAPRPPRSGQRMKRLALPEVEKPPRATRS